jgi:tetratricopeptide (TPR) repeat protein
MTGDFSLVHQNVSQELTEERWRRLEELFHAARELGEEARVRFLDIETAGQPQLRRELEEMLAHSGTAANLLAGTVSKVAREASGRVEWIGRRVGPYRLVREIGRGGMGVVFEACRDDDEYRKTVALKLAPAWRDWQTLGERLRHERQILAGLEHPNIARFLEGGSQDGVPYFAMEYVQGSPIVEFCKLRRLGVHSRIELFRHVCAAVHYAHERLVVHRDLKPANILVTREGVPKLLDFGIAKLLTPAPGDENTTGGTCLWTPDYTSPEQVRGGAVTIRTDVYLLGLVLYELLCGEKAQETDSSSPLALDRSVCESEPEIPSQRAAARGDATLARELRGDLDIIVAMALRKEPDRRYGSAEALSEDLARYLDGRPVLARPGSLGYRVGKTIRRHRAAVAAAALILLSTTGGVFATVYQAHRAERRFQEVRRLANSVLFGVDDRIRNLAGATEAREWAVSNALQYLNSLAKDADNDRALLFELATAYQKVGDVQGYGTQPSLGHTEAALESQRKALEIAEYLAARDSDPKVQRLLARAHQRVISLSRLFRRTDVAVEDYLRALAAAEKLYATQPGDPENADLLSSLLLSLGGAELRAGDVDPGSRTFARAFVISSVWAKQQPGEQSQARVEGSRRMLVRSRLYTGDLESAARLAREHVDGMERLAASRPDNASLRRDLMNSYVEMAYVYWHPGFLNYDEPETAALFHKKALVIAKELAEHDPSNATAQFDLAIAEADYCDALNQWRPSEALVHCREAMAVAGRWPNQFVPDAILAYLADSLARLGRGREALDPLKRCIEMRVKLVASDPSHFSRHQNLLRAYTQMASLLLDLGDRHGALEHRQKALALAEAMVSSKPDNLVARRDLADTYEGLGRHYEGEDRGQASEWYRKSLAIWTEWPSRAPSTRMDQVRRDRVSSRVARLERRL